MTFALAQLAELLGAHYDGAPDIIINGISTLEDAQQGDITFLSSPLYKKYLASTKASVVILSEADAKDCPTSKIITPNPYLAYAKVSAFFQTSAKPASGIAPSAVISPSASIHPSASIAANVVIEDNVAIAQEVVIGPGCVIGSGSRIGKGTRLWANVTLYHDITIGEDCIIHSGAVIGADGFGFASNNGSWHKIEQIGTVIIGNNVEVGASTTIDRGAIENTIIEDGVKIDNQIQIGHNTHIGAHTAIAGGVLIAGSAKIGKYCQIGGGSGIAGHLSIADNTILTAMTMVMSSITKSGIYASTTVLQEHGAWQKNSARFKQLDNIAKQVKQLEKRLQAFENRSQDTLENE